MFFLKNLKIGWRLAVSFGSLLLCVLLVGVIGVNRMGAINDSVQRIISNDTPMLDAALQLEIDARGTAIRSHELFILPKEKFAAVNQALAVNEKGIADNVATITKLADRSDEREALAKMQASLQAYQAVYRKVGKLLAESDDKEPAIALMSSEFTPAYDALKRDLAALSNVQRKQLAAAPAASQATYQMGGNIILGASLLATLIGIGFSIYVTRSITGPIRRAVKVAETVASGDLTSEIRSNRPDETGQLLRALKNMNDSLVKIVADVRSGTDAIATSSAEIAGGNQDLSARTEQQAAALEETAASMDELTNTVRQNGDNAAQADSLAKTASEVAVRGGAVVHEVVATMGEINESSRRIVDIISVIDGIAFQTNILALNAAVEAARAGEQGRGFAVVASEVRTLAQRSAAAAKEIKGLISASVERVEVGSKLVNQAGSTMNEVVESIRHVTDIMGEIMAASHEQTTGIVQVNRAVMEMDDMTQQNAALVEQAAAAAAAMQEQAHGLSHVVDMFRLDGAQAVAKRAPVIRAVPAARPAVAPQAPARVQMARATAPRKIANGAEDWEEF